MQATWIQLFFTFFKIGFLAIGGAYSFLPLFEEELVENHQWITQEEFTEILGTDHCYRHEIPESVSNQQNLPKRL